MTFLENKQKSEAKDVAKPNASISKIKGQTEYVEGEEAAQNFEDLIKKMLNTQKG